MIAGASAPCCAGGQGAGRAEILWSRLTGLASFRHCERSEAIQGGRSQRPWIAAGPPVPRNDEVGDGWLPPGELARALLHEGGHAFLLVLGAEQAGEQAAFEGDALDEP